MTQISGTAFLVNYLRSKNKELSGDIYSDLWIEETTAEEKTATMFFPKILLYWRKPDNLLLDKPM